MSKSGIAFVIFVVCQKDTTTAALVLGTPTKAKKSGRAAHFEDKKSKFHLIYSTYISLSLHSKIYSIYNYDTAPHFRKRPKR